MRKVYGVCLNCGTITIKEARLPLNNTRCPHCYLYAVVKRTRELMGHFKKKHIKK